MHKTRSSASVAALLALLALAPSVAEANPAHHGDTVQMPGQTARSTTQSQAQGGQPGGGMMGSGAATGPGMGPGMMGPGTGSGTMGPGMMGGGMMGGGMMGGGMMGGGMMGPGMMGPGTMGGGLGACGGMDGDKDLSANQVKDILEGHLAWMGNERLKVGKVETMDDDTYLAEIVTVDDSLVQTLEVDRNTGAMRPVK